MVDPFSRADFLLFLPTPALFFLFFKRQIKRQQKETTIFRHAILKLDVGGCGASGSAVLSICERIKYGRRSVCSLSLIPKRLNSVVH